MFNLKFIIILNLLVCCINYMGCSCTKKEQSFKITHQTSRTYDADIDEEGFRIKSKLSNEKNDQKYYSSFLLLKKRESREIIEKLNMDGKRALKMPDFIKAEELYSQGKYEEALKYYNRLTTNTNNLYIKRRALKCQLSYDRVKAREDSEFKKANELIVNKNYESALNILDKLEQKNTQNKNIYLHQNISALKMKIYNETENYNKLVEECIKEEKLKNEYLKLLSESWTTPIE